MPPWLPHGGQGAQGLFLDITAAENAIQVSSRQTDVDRYQTLLAYLDCNVLS